MSGPVRDWIRVNVRAAATWLETPLGFLALWLVLEALASSPVGLAVGLFAMLATTAAVALISYIVRE